MHKGGIFELSVTHGLIITSDISRKAIPCFSSTRLKSPTPCIYIPRRLIKSKIGLTPCTFGVHVVHKIKLRRKIIRSHTFNAFENKN